MKINLDADLKDEWYLNNKHVILYRKKETKKRKLYFNNLLHIHQHTFLKYMIQSVIDGKNQKTNMSVYDIPTCEVVIYKFITSHFNHREQC